MDDAYLRKPRIVYRTGVPNPLTLDQYNAVLGKSTFYPYGKSTFYLRPRSKGIGLHRAGMISVWLMPFFTQGRTLTIVIGGRKEGNTHIKIFNRSNGATE